MKTLDQANKLVFHEADADHLHLTHDQIIEFILDEFI